MSELKVNTISEVTGANGVVIDSVKLKDGEVYATKIQYTDGDDAITIADGGGITVAQAATFSSTIGSGNITSTGTIQGTSITATTAFVPDASDGAALGTTALEFSDLFLADGAVIGLGDDQEVTLTHVADTGLTLNSTNKLMFNDASQFIQGTSATVLSIGATDEIDLTATTVDLNGTLNVSGVATFQAAPVFPDGSLALADLDIDGGTDIGAAIADADLLIVDDGAGGTNRKATAARLKTYMGDLNTPIFRAYAATAQTHANGADSVVVFGSEEFDPQSTFDGTSTFTPGVAGKYFLKASVRMEGAADNGQNEIYIRKNSSIVASFRHNSSGTGPYMLEISDIATSDADDTFRVEVYQATGGNVNSSAGATSSIFTAFKITD